MRKPNPVQCECGGEGRVIDKRDRSAGYTFRRRKCDVCQARWTTREIRVDDVEAQAARFRFDVVMNAALSSDVVELRDPRTGALLARLEGVREP